MKLKKLILASGAIALAATSFQGSAADLEMSTNIAAGSNYVWRGATQTANASAISGGIDAAHSSGLYVGTWTSNVSGGHEVDFYAGYAGEVADFGYDVGLIYYGYTESADADFTELAVSASYNVLTLGVNYTLDGDADEDTDQFVSEDVYYYAALSVDMPQDFSLGITAGSYDFTNDSSSNSTSYSHYQIDIGKSAGDFGDFTMSFSKAGKEANSDSDDIPTDDALVFVTWGKTF
ncbi:MAG: TorF family putative porin [Candidatus Polarisedimenticolaceae bacterium]|nr:TorF family putative porin [Candidatus Polarisedimenticolaceae bacterium]